MPDVVCSHQACMGVIFLSRINRIVQVRHVDGSESGHIREAVISDAKESESVFADIEDAIGVELVLLPMFKAVQETVPVRGLQRNPRMGVRSRTPAGYQIKIAIISCERDKWI